MHFDQLHMMRIIKFVSTLIVSFLLSNCGFQVNKIDKTPWNPQGIWTGQIHNLTHNISANFSMQVECFDRDSGGVNGYGLITGSLVGSGKFHGRFSNKSGEFKLIPSSGIGAPVSFKCKITGNSMSGIYTVPSQDGLSQQNGKFELIKKSNQQDKLFEKQISERAEQEAKSWNHVLEINNNTKNDPPSRPTASAKAHTIMNVPPSAPTASVQAPTSPDSREIDQQVATILAGEHNPLPPAQHVRPDPAARVAEMVIKNNTGHTLTVLYSGPTSQRVSLAPKASCNVVLGVGTYQVAATVNSASVIPFAGRDYIRGGSYDNTFYIKTTHR